MRNAKFISGLYDFNRKDFFKGHGKRKTASTEITFYWS